jgi:hypothetical protein
MKIEFLSGFEKDLAKTRDKKLAKIILDCIQLFEKAKPETRNSELETRNLQPATIPQFNHLTVFQFNHLTVFQFNHLTVFQFNHLTISLSLPAEIEKRSHPSARLINESMDIHNTG